MNLLRRKLSSFQSSDCLKYVFESCSQNPDVVIELGGGIGHNLARILCDSFTQNPQRLFILMLNTIVLDYPSRKAYLIILITQILNLFILIITILLLLCPKLFL